MSPPSLLDNSPNIGSQSHEWQHVPSEWNVGTLEVGPVTAKSDEGCESGSGTGQLN